MINKVTLTRFKKFKYKEFCLHSNGVTLLVGGNNSGKTTLIHALSVWEFCKMVLSHEKGRGVFNKDSVGKSAGFGMSAEEFLPLAVPSLNHLWTNLKTQLSTEEKEKAKEKTKFPGYILRIRCDWCSPEKATKYLEIGLSLVNDRMFIQITDSNLDNDDYIPSVVYIPTLAAVLPKENKATIAERRAYLGRGMAGSVLRNMIYDLYQKDAKLRNSFRKHNGRLSSQDKAFLSTNSPLELLQTNLRNTFKSELEIEPFSEEFNTVIKINERKVISKDGVYETLPKTQYTPRDIISQGSGYLQWLSIFCILYSPETDIVLLDEPDAHLHASLQSELLNRLLEIDNGDNRRQIIISTHSVEMIKRAPYDVIFNIDKNKYLDEEKAKVAVLAGIGSEYSPKIDQLKRYKKVLFVENESDYKILGILADRCGLTMPLDIVIWPTTDSHIDRKHIFMALQEEIPGIKGISLRDRDMETVESVDENLAPKALSRASNEYIIFLQWRRKHIESYLLCPNAIAKASGKPIEEVKDLIASFALYIPDKGYPNIDCPEPINTCDAKKIYSTQSSGIEAKFGCNKYDVAKKMDKDEVCDDIKTFINRLNQHFS